MLFGDVFEPVLVIANIAVLCSAAQQIKVGV